MERDLDFEYSVGQKVRELRRKLGWSQQVLADYANIERNQIRRVEGAKHSCSIATITSIARALGRQPYELIKADHLIKVSKNLDSAVKRRRVTTKYVLDITSSSFLNRPRSVEEIVMLCEQKLDVSIPSSATSAVLKKLVDEGLLKRMPSSIKGRYRYQRIEKIE
ncbi:MAG: helix-turn-helix transcriptional regulator [Cyclobacteriaceae bacterium]|nr:helix-turn-helix transcriptional regulator [Cyclobacteriaceae bacterium]